MNRFEDKIAIVTGAASGIGRATADRLRSEGGTVVGIDRDPVDDVDMAMQLDLLDLDAIVPTVAQIVDAYGRIDGLVNNAAVNVFAHFWTQSESTLDETIATNLTAPFYLCQAAANFWVENGLGGAIVNISSAEDTIAYPEQVPYACSKGGLLSLTKVLALEWGPLGIRVNAVSPGSVDTEMTPDVYRQEAPKLMPIGRLGRPEDIGACVFFLLSDDAAFVTGTALYADGGYMLQ